MVVDLNMQRSIEINSVF